MKRLSLLAMLLACATAQAMWVTVTHNEVATVYVDSAAIVKVGNLKRIWVVYDLQDPDSAGQRSVKSYIEYDCSDNTYKTLSANSYAQPMGRGPVIKSMPINTASKPVTQDSLSRQVYGFACAW